MSAPLPNKILKFLNNQSIFISSKETESEFSAIYPVNKSTGE